MKIYKAVKRFNPYVWLNAKKGDYILLNNEQGNFFQARYPKAIQLLCHVYLNIGMPQRQSALNRQELVRLLQSNEISYSNKHKQILDVMNILKVKPLMETK